MSRVKPREVLCVQKCGPDYYWFWLRVSGLVALHVMENNARWEIDDNRDKTQAYIQREYYQHGDGPRKLQVKQARIVGPRQQIMNLLSSLGNGTPDRVVLPQWGNEDDQHQ